MRRLQRAPMWPPNLDVDVDVDVDLDVDVDGESTRASRGYVYGHAYVYVHVYDHVGCYFSNSPAAFASRRAARFAFSSSVTRPSSAFCADAVASATSR